MPYKEKEIEKLYYTIGEVANLFGVNTSHIRFWSNEFDVIRPATNKKGNRLYTRDDIENFRKIYHLVKEKGFTLRGAKTELRDMKSKSPVTDIAEAELPTSTADVPVPQFNEPVDRDGLMPAAERLHNDDIVDRMAFRNSLEKMRSELPNDRRNKTHLPSSPAIPMQDGRVH